MIEFSSKMVFRFFAFILLISYADARKPRPRIFGGKDAATGQFPFVVMTSNLLTLDDGNIEEVPTCTGSLIAADWVLTAAHCILDDNITAFVLAGNANVLKAEQKRKVKKSVIFPEYIDTGILFFDIGLYELEEGFNLESPNVGLADLSAAKWPSSELTNRTCLAMGYGLVSEDPYTETEVLQWSEMNASHGPGACQCYPEVAQNFFICLERRRDKTICSGDSGGPLVCDGKVVGVASHISPFNESCDRFNSTLPPCGRGQAAYTFIDPFLDWIRKEMMQTSASERPKPIATLIICICFINMVVNITR